jgi:hypothetical protein
MDKQYDEKVTYCRKLGHHLAFKYCRGEREGLPCSKILDCWFQIIPVEKFIRDNYSEAGLASLAAPSRPRMMTLIDLIERAKKRGGGGEGRQPTEG